MRLEYKIDHNNLKPENLFLNNNNKIIFMDFYLQPLLRDKLLTKTGPLYRNILTKNFNNFLYHKDISDNFIYVSPEIRNNYEMHTNKNIEKNDVFVLGLIMLE